MSDSSSPFYTCRWCANTNIYPAFSSFFFQFWVFQIIQIMNYDVNKLISHALPGTAIHLGAN